MEEEEADEARRVVRNFIKQYTFLLQVMPFEDKAMQHGLQLLYQPHSSH